MAARAVVFAYHNVGAMALRSLHAAGIDIALVVTHRDNPQETIWFERVSAVADALGLPWIAPDDPNVPAVLAQVAALAPDFIFSAYYRHMLAPALLACAKRGALNLHGSLLPHYRGRVPINWAILRGETQTGVTLHYMAARPDAGDIVAQRAVAIGPDDTAQDVFGKVTTAGAELLDATIPALVAGTAPRLPNRIAEGSYFGGRSAEDGRIDWSLPAAAIHNLVRAVAPPYPGAFCELAGHRIRVLRSERPVAGLTWPRRDGPGLFASGGAVFAQGADGLRLRVTAADCDGIVPSADAWAALLPPATAA